MTKGCDEVVPIKSVAEDALPLVSQAPLVDVIVLGILVTRASVPLVLKLLLLIVHEGPVGPWGPVRPIPVGPVGP